MAAHLSSEAAATHPNGCKFNRPKASVVEAERKTYNAKTFEADTMWCHHLDEEGRHIVLNELPTAAARACAGVIYFSLGFTGKQFKCGEHRPLGKGHNQCTAGRCPFMRDGEACPYMEGKTKLYDLEEKQ